jgi:hypothetical protein
MSEFTDMLVRINVDNLLSYLIFGSDSKIKHLGTYEERIQESYNKIFATFEEMFPSVNRQNNDLYGAVMDFSITHNEVYLEMGLIIGFQLFKNMEQKNQNIDLAGMQAIINKNWYADRGMEKEE